MTHKSVPPSALLAAILGLSLTQPLSAQTLADALDQPAWTITSSGNLPWTGQATTTHDGVDAAKSGAITHSQTSEMSTAVTGPGMVSFWWKVSSESDYDHLRFYIDGVEQSGKISGTVDWTQKSYSLAAGSHILKWAYSKDSYGFSGSDCGWVDQVELSPPAPEISVEQPVGTELTDGGTGVNFSAEPGYTMVKTFTIKNPGVLELTGLALSKDGTDAGDFTLGTLGATSLASGASTTFAVTFRPGVAGSKTAAIHIASNDADENTFDINLTGITVPFIYTTSGGLVTITGYNGSGGAVAIPSMIDGMPVVSIGNSAFEDESSLTSVNIPASVTSIGSYAFGRCASLTTISVDTANPNYSSLDGVLLNKAKTVLIQYPGGKAGGYTIPAGITTIGYNAFLSCAGLTSIAIPIGVTNIKANAFYNCAALASMAIPASVTTIEGSAFSYCSSLTSVSIPISVTNIGDSAFWGCTALTNMSIPASVTSIGTDIFTGCAALSAIVVEAANPNYSSVDGVLFNKSGTTLMQYPCAKAGAYIIPTSVNSIKARAFYFCTGLTCLSIPDSIISIENGTFWGCSGLTGVTIPNSVTIIKDYAFYLCRGLTNATFLGNAPTMSSSVFGNTATGFTIYYDPAKTGFTSPTWQGYATLALPTTQEIAMEQPAGTNLVDGSASVAFGHTDVGTTVVKTFTIRNRGTLDLLGLALSKDGPNAGDFTLGSLGATSLVLGASTTFTVTFAPGSEGTKSAAIHIANNDSDENPFDINLTGTTVPYTYNTSAGKVIITGYTGSGGAAVIPAIIDGLPVAGIGNNAFNGKSSLQSVTIPNGVTSISSYAFADCSGLTSVTIPVSVTSIGDGAFTGCERLVAITIPTGVTSMGTGVFSYCWELAAITVDPLNPSYASLDGVLFNKGLTRLIECPSGKTGTCAVPASVTVIDEDALRLAENLQSIQVSPLNTTYATVSDALFNKNLTTLIRYPAGRGGSFVIPSGVTRIESDAFFISNNLTDLTIPNSVTSIGLGAISRCDGITQITLPTSLTSIESNLFYGCNNLSRVNIPAGVTSIGSSAFGDCTSLTSIIIPSGVASISSYAFGDCTALSRATFLGNAPSMQSGVFTNTATGFVIYYNPAKTGFSTPTWNGYPALPLATTREFSLSGPGGVNITDNGIAQNCGSVYLGAVSRLAFTIRNEGSTDLTGLAITKDGLHAADFSVSSLDKTTLTPGDETAFTITFAPTAAGVRNAAIHIASNDADENPFDIPLIGEGLDRVRPFEGARRVASTVNQGFEPAVGVALDAQGNRLMTGWFDGTNDFGGTSLTALGGGGQDIFVGKYSAAGVLQWARRAGGNTDRRDAGRGIGVDNAGNVYVTGGFSGTADFGTLSLTASQSQDFFLAKYDSAGTVQWVRQNTAGAATDSAYGIGLAVDGSGNSYAVGYYDGNNLRFGATTLPTPADYQCFLVKHDAAGTVQWSKALAASGQVYATKLALDSLGNVCVGGGFSGNMNLDGTLLASAGSRDLFLAKFSSAGVLQWARRAGGTGKDEGDGGVAIDSENNVLFGGGFESASIDIGGIVLTNSGGMDAFVAKYNPSGTVQWASKNGTAGLDVVASLAVDRNGYSYAAGTLGSSGGTAGVAKYDRNGVLQWEYAAVGSPATPVASLAAHCAVDAAGNCHLVGWYQGQATFGSQTLQPQGFLNYFLTTIPADPFAGAYPNLTWDGNDNVSYLEQDGVERATDGYLKIVRNDPTHYSAEISEGSNQAIVPNLVRIGNRLQLDTSPMDMGDSRLLDFIVLSDGINWAFAATGQEKSDATDISIIAHSWSGYTGTTTADDFVGTWTFNAYGDDLLDPNDRFESDDPVQFEIRKTGADTLDLVSPWNYSLPLRVSGNQAFLETTTVGSGTRYFSFRICTDGQKLSFHALGKDDTDSGPFAVIGLGVKQATPTKPAVATLAASSITSSSATLNGTVNPNGLASTAQFEYGLTTAYGSTASVTLSPNNGSAPQNVSASISGLQPGQTYHYRLTATNSGGTGTGLDQTFTTTAPTILSGTWLLANGFPAATSLLSDPNGDGVNLLLAYALNLNPNLNLSGTVPRPVVTADRTTLTYYSGNPDVTYLVETSTDLNVWSTVGVTHSAAAANGLRTATFLKAGPTRFMRLRPIIKDSVYGPWRAARFSTADLANAAVSGDLADPDRDGIPNLLEYAIGGQPKAADTNFTHTPGRSSGYLTLTYRQSKSATDIAFMPQATANPTSGTWSAAGLVETGRVDHGTYWLVTVRDAVPIATTPQRFMRLMVVH